MTLKERALAAYKETEEKRERENLEQKAREYQSAHESLRLSCENAFRLPPEHIDIERRLFVVQDIPIIEHRSGYADRFQVVLDPCPKCGRERRSYYFHLYDRANLSDSGYESNLANLGSALAGEAEYHECRPPRTEDDEAPAPPPPRRKPFTERLGEQVLEIFEDIAGELGYERKEE
jgi:hypothetical protein